MIYFVQAVDGGPVKIGYSADVDARRVQLESHYGKRLALLKTLPGDKEREREIHQQFSHLRLGRTEQFLPVSELMEFIAKPLLATASPDAVAVMTTTAKPVRLDLSPADHERLERQARKRGLSMASFVRMLVLERLDSLESKG